MCHLHMWLDGHAACLSLHQQGWEIPALPVQSVPLLNQWWAESTYSSQIHMELNIPIVIGVNKKILPMNTSVKIDRPKLNGISLFIFPNWLKVKFEWWNAQRQGCALSAQWRLTVFLIQTLKELKITARRDGRRAARNIEFFKKKHPWKNSQTHSWTPLRFHSSSVSVSR